MPEDLSEQALAIPDQSSLSSQEHSLELSSDKDAVYDEKTWESIGGWLNIPLDPKAGNMFEQISAFFQAQTIASGQETITYLGRDHKSHNIIIPTADVHVPRKDRNGIPTKSWYLFQHTLPEGSEHIGISAERQNSFSPQGEETRPARLDFVKKSGSKFYTLIEKDRHVAENNYINQGAWPTGPSDIGRELENAIQKGSMDAKVFHVYNKVGELPSGYKSLQNGSPSQ